MYRVPTDQGVMNEDGFNYSHNIFVGFPLHREKGGGRIRQGSTEYGYFAKIRSFMC